MGNETNEYYNALIEIHYCPDTSLRAKYRRMRDVLERICRSQMQNESLQMTDLSARISFLVAKAGLSNAEQYRLHTFRLASNKLLNGKDEPREEDYLRDLKTLTFSIRKLFKQDIPLELYTVLPKQEAIIPSGKKVKSRIKRLRVCFQYADDEFLYASAVDEANEELLRIRYNVPQVNNEFSRTVEQLWRHALLNLLDVSVDEQGVYTPSFIVLEPDYMIDISTLAECFKDYGSHPANYMLGKLLPSVNTRPLLLGNIANLFLDEWIHAKGEVDYRACMQKAFQNYPIEIAACEDLLDPVKERQFFQDCEMHFRNIKETVTNTFQAPGYDLNREDAVLEPSYLCEALGLQGRLDYMQRDMSSFIEMKSGKADEYAIRGKIEPKENNKVQMLLYLAVLEYSMGMDHRKVRPYLFYTRYPLLYPARPSWALVKRAINLRNLIVANEYGIQLHNNPEYTSTKLKEINSQKLNEKGLNGRFWEVYLKPSIDSYENLFNRLTPLEQVYYLSLYNFITKEQYTSKSGDQIYEGRMGASSLWLSTLTEKREAGEILYDLCMTENHAADEHKSYIILSIPVYDDDAQPNFRSGDIIVLYERNSDEDNVTNKMVFKGNLEYISADEVKIRIRATQRNRAVLPSDSKYAIEHDVMDTSFKSMFQGLHAFMQANKERRDLLLSQRPPRFDDSFARQIAQANDDFNRVTLKALAAQDYFLLVGPPGTGKTSRALKKMVEAFYSEADSQILLLAYTNRAVDEICKSISSISPEISFIRVGSELSCDEVYRNHLLENELASCQRRSEVGERIASCRVIVGTVASIANKTELFKLKTFNVAIIDEATQILEPQLLSIFCAKNRTGENAVGKFILIGDHKQLPAVVIQDDNSARVCEEELLNIGITSLKDSLFERLYKKHGRTDDSWATDMLCKQGRMNPEVALFPNKAFYGGKLESVGLLHQTEKLNCIPEKQDDPLEKLMGLRLGFIPSKRETGGFSNKSNRLEAQLVARLAAKVYQHYKLEFNVNRTLGIITPYRTQIALIRKEISALAIPDLNSVLVDTVERFQGSERDVIIYSFCVNDAYQMKFLANVIEEDGVLIDRKLNVALTRARKQMFIIGVPELLELNLIYNNLLKLIINRGGFTEL